jgi:hypothetical protein
MSEWLPPCLSPSLSLSISVPFFFSPRTARSASASGLAGSSSTHCNASSAAFRTAHFTSVVRVRRIPCRPSSEPGSRDGVVGVCGLCADLSACGVCGTSLPDVEVVVVPAAGIVVGVVLTTSVMLMVVLAAVLAVGLASKVSVTIWWTATSVLAGCMTVASTDSDCARTLATLSEHRLGRRTGRIVSKSTQRGEEEEKDEEEEEEEEVVWLPDDDAHESRAGLGNRDVLRLGLHNVLQTCTNRQAHEYTHE